jgi:hypothetical protein
MGLADILNSMQNEPSGQRAFGSGGGGISPLKMALLGLLAYKAIKSFSGGQASGAPPDRVPQPVLTPARPAPDPLRQGVLVIC